MKIKTSIAFFILVGGILFAQPKTALLIANGDYSFFLDLAGSVVEARNLASELRNIGFDVILLENASKEKMLDGFSDFESKLNERGGIAFFHYGGHGVQSNGENYLLPVDSEIPDEKRLQTRAVPASEIFSVLSSVKTESNIVIIDACRNNPLPSSSTRGATRGLTVVGESPKNTIIVYSAEAGKTAIDGVFTPILTSMIGSRNLGFSEILKEVRSEVFGSTQGVQIPGEYSQLFTDIYLNGNDSGQKTLIKSASVKQGAEKTGLSIGLDIGGSLLLGPSAIIGYNFRPSFTVFMLVKYASFGLLTSKMYPDGWVLSEENWTFGMGGSYYFPGNAKDGKFLVSLQGEYFFSSASGYYNTQWQTDQTSQGMLISGTGGYFIPLGPDVFLQANAGVQAGKNLVSEQYHHDHNTTEKQNTETIRIIPQFGFIVGYAF